jgi:CRP-like cAMP-binding protein
VTAAGNIAFITYAFGHHLYPVLILHARLLPVNCLRLLQIRRSNRRVRGECRGDLSNEWLIPLMSRRTFKSGDVLFGLGDRARSMFLILRGSVRVAEIQVAFGPGSLVGGIGVFAADSCRTGTALCETDVEVGSISADRALQLYCQDPTFGLYLMPLVIQRLLVGERRRAARHRVRFLQQCRRSRRPRPLGGTPAAWGDPDGDLARPLARGDDEGPRGRSSPSTVTPFPRPWGRISPKWGYQCP